MQRRHVSSLVFALAITTALVLGVAGCGGETTTTTAATTETTAGSTETTAGSTETTAGSTETTAGSTETTAGSMTTDVRETYALNCAPCHGAFGEGGAGPNLQAHTDAAAVEAQVKNGGGAMPAFGDKLSAEDITALGKFVVDLE